MKLSRRGFLAVTGAATLAGCGLDASPGQSGELLRSKAKLPTPFTVPLPIPPTKKPTSPGRYRVVQRKARLEILPGLKTEVLGYDGLFPGPTFDVRSGQTTVIEQVNELDVPTAVHLHGGHTPAASDGWPLDLLMPPGGHHDHGHHSMGGGDVKTGSRLYTYPNAQRAATLWYHDHRMDYTAPQVYRGLFGLHLIRDAEEDKLSLPAGEREIPLVIADRAFDEDGSFIYPAAPDRPGVESKYMEGVIGDVTLVNGAPWPIHEVDAVRYRLRILNAANARRYELAFDHGPAKFTQIGSDGGLLGAPVDHETLLIAPAERFDVIVDFSAYQPGDEVTLVNRLDRNAPVLRFKVARRAADDSHIPARLSTYAAVEPPAGAVRRLWRFRRGSAGGHQGWTINGKAFDPVRMQAQVRLGEYEIWSFVTDVHHPVHVHLAPFQVLSRRGGDPGPYDGGWKDTVDVRPAEVVEVLVRFSAHKGKYLIHCHNLEHEDMAMMAGFETI
ncbi:multicopper oxidase domain-containing protein [Kribbella sandramycini]|uniref:Multicopper oxidase CueO n=1 Tax=Kribbella sandramycini TaxID=60450 RepID=A0A7Y4L0Q3_9ACTN|nr:multicopper oxidase domain-containing protein [Kribbella sandramycini]MBB6564489.1 FtsP/CotA-like multicopper oxidase with cupredoxin domain [Kribbella sandramycini]NOL42193.1 multicopper oxidase domain-containing protein [Kribbella sandramycini]